MRQVFVASRMRDMTTELDFTSARPPMMQMNAMAVVMLREGSMDVEA